MEIFTKLFFCSLLDTLRFCLVLWWWKSDKNCVHTKSSKSRSVFVCFYANQASIIRRVMARCVRFSLHWTLVWIHNIKRALFEKFESMFSSDLRSHSTGDPKFEDFLHRLRAKPLPKFAQIDVFMFIFVKFNGFWCNIVFLEKIKNPLPTARGALKNDTQVWCDPVTTHFIGFLKPYSTKQNLKVSRREQKIIS